MRMTRLYMGVDSLKEHDEPAIYRISPTASEKRDQADFSGMKVMIDSVLIVNRRMEFCSFVQR
jgi:hypothetical protein